MKLPRVIYIGPFVYEVQCSPISTLTLAAQQRIGECSYEDLAIRLAHSLAPGQTRETLLHEAMHALSNMAGLDHELGDEAEEKVVRRLAPLLLALLRDNPKLVRFLTDE